MKRKKTIKMLEEAKETWQEADPSVARGLGVAISLINNASQKWRHKKKSLFIQAMITIINQQLDGYRSEVAAAMMNEDEEAAKVANAKYHALGSIIQSMNAWKDALDRPKQKRPSQSKVVREEIEGVPNG